MKTATQKKLHARSHTPRKRVVNNGEKHILQLDRLTNSRLHHAENLIRVVLGTETNISGVTRAAVAHYLDHLEGVLKKLSTLEENDEKGMRIVANERYRVLSANRGGTPPWTAYPAEKVAQRLADPSVPMPFLDDLMKQKRKEQLAISKLPEFKPEDYKIRRKLDEAYDEEQQEEQGRE